MVRLPQCQWEELVLDHRERGPQSMHLQHPDRLTIDRYTYRQHTEWYKNLCNPPLRTHSLAFLVLEHKFIHHKIKGLSLIKAS